MHTHRKKSQMNFVPWFPTYFCPILQSQNRNHRHPSWAGKAFYVGYQCHPHSVTRGMNRPHRMGRNKNFNEKINPFTNGQLDGWVIWWMWSNLIELHGKRSFYRNLKTGLIILHFCQKKIKANLKLWIVGRFSCTVFCRSRIAQNFIKKNFKLHLPYQP